jgi:mono/diheme cytochrome c family protein
MIASFPRMAAYRIARATAFAMALLTAAGAGGTTEAADTPGDPERGAYILRLGGCTACHTDMKNNGAPLAGGGPLKSPYGTFYAPNITPDKETGIGGWSTEDFIRAMTEGKPPSGLPYYPAFPYTSYTHMKRQDLIDLKAYLDTVKPVKHDVPPHDLRFPYNMRIGIVLWRLLFFEAGPFVPDPDKSADWNRGAYIVTGPAHCGECHSPRNFFGAVDDSQALVGTTAGPDGKAVPGITQHDKRGIGGWSKGDIAYFLDSGLLPDGDFIGGSMAEVIEYSASHWTDADREAVAEYLLSLPER